MFLFYKNDMRGSKFLVSVATALGVRGAGGLLCFSSGLAFEPFPLVYTSTSCTYSLIKFVLLKKYIYDVSLLI
jgi:hypothetical protein